VCIIKKEVENPCGLRIIIMKRNRQKFELFVHPGLGKGKVITGYVLDYYLRNTWLYDRTLSLENEAVRGWLKHPETYPEKYKGKAVFLWKQWRVEIIGTDRIAIAYLVWDRGRVIVGDCWVGYEFCGSNFVLLTTKAKRSLVVR